MTDSQAGAGAPKNFELLSNEDKQKIILKLKEVPRDQVTKFVYQNKRQEWALTAEATKWIVREMADKGEAIRIDGHPKVERDLVDPEWMTCSVLGNRVKVEREGKSQMILDSNIGSARTWIKQKIGKDENAKIIPDEFWYTKLVSKATRNLQQSMIPNEFKKAIITRLLEIQAGKAGGSQSQQSSQPAQGQQRQSQQAAAGQGAQGGGTASGGPSKPQGQPPPVGQGVQGDQSRPKGSPPPAGQGAQGDQSKPQGQPPANQGQQKSQQPPTNQGQQKSQQTQKPAGQQKAANLGEVSFEAVQHGFRAVFKQFAGTEDDTTLKKILKALTGKTATTDLERGLMVELGPLLRRKIKGEVKWNGMALHEIATGEQLWPKPEPQAEPMSEPQQEEGPPPEEEGIPLF